MSVDDSVADYDFNNDNDVSNFCPDVNPDGYDDDDNGAGGGGGDDDFFGNPNDEGGMNTSLVAAPNRVEKISIGYAKQAKKMDMRRLKSIEWDLLSSHFLLNDKENDDREMNAAAEKVANGDAAAEKSFDKTSTETSFGSLYKELHVSKKMPPQMAENLSVSLAFVALLHLCNENNLALQSKPDLSDFTIRQG